MAAPLSLLDPWNGLLASDHRLYLESDILESIAKFPSLWLDQYGTFVIAMDQIAKHLSIIPDGRTLEKLYHRMDPAGKDAYFHFMADRL